MSRVDIEILVHKKLTEGLSSEEQAMLDAYLQTPESEGAESDIAQLWHAAGDYSPSVNFDSGAAFGNLMARIEKEEPIEVENNEAKVYSIFSFRNLSKLAAVFLIALSGYLSYNSLSGDSFVSGSETAYAMLDDGTSVWLAPHSKLEYSSSLTNGREATLSGKAYFDVARDEARPFSIHSDEITITVLGTSFTVDGHTGEVSVNSGKVAVTSDTDAVTLTKGDKASVLDTKFQVGHTSREDFDWVNPVLKFDNTPLDQVLKELSLHFQIEIVYKGRTDLSKCPFTATNLNDASLDQILSILEATYSMEVKHMVDGKSIFLSKVRCR